MQEDPSIPQEETRHTAEEQTVDTNKLQALKERLKPEQNLILGILGGIGGAILGALAWAVITVATGYQMGYMAVGVGFLVGIGLRSLGKGIDPIFGYIGATLTLLGCLLGNFLSLVYYVAQEVEATYMQMLAAIDYTLIPSLLWETAGYKTFLFYSIAIYEGYSLAFRKIDERQLT